MDFFEHQDAARKNTGRLVILFIIAAVIGIIGAAYVVGLLAITLAGVNSAPPLAHDPGVLGVSGAVFNLPLFAATVILTTTIVGGGSTYKIAQLRGGGHIVAEQLRGRRVVPGTTDRLERRLLNIVDEMAIASGTPAPPVYIMDDEAGINAFAAGFAPADAVIGVTRGCIETLTRDELQGVIAHEFSHILNGDMRLNIRLMGVLHGILLVGLIGYHVIRSMAYSRSGRRGSNGGGALLILVVGLGLIVIGAVGTFFGTWIKAAVSRQREYLADASAVQFTRNPRGIADALKRILGYTQGTHIDNPGAPAASHMFFGRAVASGFHALFATHPPLPDRIRKLDPSWNGTAIKTEQHPGSAPTPGSAGFAPSSPLSESRTHPPPPASAPPATRSLLEQIGLPQGEHVEHAARLLARLPAGVLDDTREPFCAQAVVCALLIDQDPHIAARQFDLIGEHAPRGLEHETRKLVAPIRDAGDDVRLPLIDLTIPALQTLTPAQHQAFRSTVHAIVIADERIDLFEWCIQRTLIQRLDGFFNDRAPTRVHYYGLTRLKSECRVLISVVARTSSGDRRHVEAAYAAGAARLAPLEIGEFQKHTLRDLDDALRKLSRTAPRLKRQLLDAAATAIASDHAVTTTEAELFRAIADALDCPAPPLLPGQRLA